MSPWSTMMEFAPLWKCNPSTPPKPEAHNAIGLDWFLLYSARAITPCQGWQLETSPWNVVNIMALHLLDMVIETLNHDPNCGLNPYVTPVLDPPLPMYSC
jgi:hypothetical protein